MIRLNKISKGFGTKQLFADIDYHFPSGERIALIGPNGAGKSTLLNIIAGVDQADGGEIVVPNHFTVAYLPQEPNPAPAPTVLEECQHGRRDLIDLKQKMETALTKSEEGNLDQLDIYERLESSYRQEGGYALEARASGILDGLGFPPAYLSMNAIQLSGGWRMRLELAKLFLREADFLILDEPTNHLDLPSLVWVETFLEKFKGTLLFVSHDRELLNRLPTQILHLNAGQIRQYKGNFDNYVEQKSLIETQESATIDQIRKKKEQLEDFINKFGSKATKAKQAQAKMKVVDKLSAQEATLGQGKTEAQIAFRLPTPHRGPRIPLTFERGSIGYTESLAHNITLKVERKLKIAIIGANGVGKSTLVKTLAGHLAPLAGTVLIADKVEISYFSQDQLDTLDETKSVIENLLASSADMGQMEARTLLGSFLFRDDDVFKKVKILSGGEKGRLGLACVLAKNANFLLLDEPTNHLDMASVEALTAAIRSYEGTVVFVSHDRRFINQCCTHIFAMPGHGETMLFEGDLTDYERLAEVANFPNVMMPSASKGSLSPTSPNHHSSDNSEISDSRVSGTGKDFKQLSKSLTKINRLIEKESLLIDENKKDISIIDQKMLEINPSSFDKINALDQQRTTAAANMERSENCWLEYLEEQERLQDALSSLGHHL